MHGMIKIMGESYLTDKEASERYGYSQSWFMRARTMGVGPKYIQIAEHGRILYPLEQTDEWFKERMRSKE
jgi:predicted DNA-binding transcriptional regulator AlpA